LVSNSQSWLKNEFEPQQVLYVAIDRTKWGCINLLMISLIWNRRALPIYWELLPKQGNSNFESQTAAITKIIRLFKDYKVVLLGDREFCSVKLGSWVAEQRAYLRLKKNEFVQLEGEIWLQLEQLGLVPECSSIWMESVCKQKDLVSSMLRASGNVNIRDGPQTKGFIMTNLPDLESAILSYKKRFGIEEMFRDFKRVVIS